MMEFAMKFRWLVAPLMAFSLSANADFCTPENGQAWYEFTADLAKDAKTCKYAIADGTFEACRPFAEKYTRVMKIHSYVLECYENFRTGPGGFGYTNRQKIEINDNTAYSIGTLRLLKEAERRTR